MQEYNKITITKDEVVPLAEKMRAKGVTLAMIHAFKEDDGTPNVSYEYQTEKGVDSYTVEGESVLPSISGIYDLAAEWPEREIMELMDITFDGVDTSERLFLPESMLNEQGQIMITSIDDLIEKKKGDRE